MLERAENLSLRVLVFTWTLIVRNTQGHHYSLRTRSTGTEELLVLLYNRTDTTTNNAPAAGTSIPRTLIEVVVALRLTLSILTVLCV